jgi:hypothetical protein
LIFLPIEYELSAYDFIVGEIRSALKSGILDLLNLYAEYLDTAHFSNESHQKTRFDSLYEKYGDMEIDLLIAIDPGILLC